jgi:signal transduction histidine kinase
MQELVTGLLLYSRIGAKRGLPHSTDCETLLEVTLENLEASIREKERAGDLRPAADRDRGHDAARAGVPEPDLERDQVLGRRSADPCGAARRSRPSSCSSCATRASGIDPSKFDRIFEAFVRLHSGNDYPGPASVCRSARKIVERHGGRIWVESAPGEGSVFYFTVPRRDISCSKPPPSPAHSVASADR